MPDTEYDDFGSVNFIDDDVRPDDQLERALHRAESAETWIGAQAVDCRDNRHRDTARSVRIVLRDIGSDIFDIREGKLREAYLHRGRGSSFLVPHDSNQRRTAS